jgi:hypothetical protein
MSAVRKVLLMRLMRGWTMTAGIRHRERLRAMGAARSGLLQATDDAM